MSHRIPPRPSVAPPAPWTFPEPIVRDLDSGLRLAAFDLPGQLVVSMRLTVPMPLRAEPANLTGLGTILARTLDEGTARRSSDEMADALERAGIALRAGITDHGLIVDVDVPRRRLRAAAELLAEAVATPAFGADEVARHVRMRRSEIDHEHADPGAMAALAFLRAYYPVGDRFARPAAGDAAGVTAVTPEALHAHHRAHVGPAGAQLAVAGDLSGPEGHERARALDELVDVFAAWQPAETGGAPAPASLAGRDEPEQRIVVVDRPGSVQSELYIGCAGPARDAAGGWAPYPVLAMVIGGAPQARLDAVLREDKGYTYGMRCGFRPRPGGGLFVTSGSVRADATVDAVRLTLDILSGARDGFGQDETRAAVDFVARTARGRFATADAVAAEAGARHLDGTGLAETSRVLRATGSLTPAALERAYRDHVSGRWTTVVVGEADSIVEPLRALGRGPVEVVENV